MPKCEKLDWNVQTTSETVVAAMRFESFEQSQRFVELIIKFIQAERKPRPILDDIAWYYPPTDTGSVTWATNEKPND